MDPGTTSSQTPNGASTYEGARGTNRIVEKVRDAATAQLTSQKDRATSGLGSISQAVRQSTSQLRDQEHDVIAHYVEQAADQIDRLSQRLRDKDVGALVSDLQRMARRRPGLFIGGAFAVGLIGARFFKSSSRTSGNTSGYGSRSGYGSESGYGTESAYSSESSYGTGAGYASEGGGEMPTSPTTDMDGSTGGASRSRSTRPSTTRPRRSGQSERS